MAWINLLWTLGVNENNERKGDEPSLQFALAAIIDGVVKVHGHTTGCIEKNYIPSFYPNISRRGSLRSGRDIPNPSNPFLGFAACWQLGAIN